MPLRINNQTNSSVFFVQCFTDFDPSGGEITEGSNPKKARVGPAEAAPTSGPSPKKAKVDQSECADGCSHNVAFSDTGRMGFGSLI